MELCKSLAQDAPGRWTLVHCYTIYSQIVSKKKEERMYVYKFHIFHIKSKAHFRFAQTGIGAQIYKRKVLSVHVRATMCSLCRQ